MVFIFKLINPIGEYLNDFVGTLHNLGVSSVCIESQGLVDLVNLNFLRPHP